MVTVEIKNDGNFNFDASSLGVKLKEFIAQKFGKPCHVEVAIVDTSEIKRLGKIYLNESGNPVHNVLSFPTTEIKGKFIFPPGNVRLGEVVVCYPVALSEARDEGVGIDTKIRSLSEHGIMHLLGFHHK